MDEAENATIKLCRYYRDNNGNPIVLPPKSSPDFKQQMTYAFDQVFSHIPMGRYWHVIKDPTLTMTENISRLIQWNRTETISNLGYSGILLRTFTEENLKFISSKFSACRLQTPKPICIDWMVVDPASNTIKLIDYSENKLAPKDIDERLKKLETTGTQLLKHLKCLYPNWEMNVEMVFVFPANSGPLETTSSHKFKVSIWTKEKIEEQQTDESLGNSSYERETSVNENKEIVAHLAFSYQHCMFEVLPKLIIPADTNDTKVNLKDFKKLISVFENQKYLSTTELTTFPPIGSISGCAVYENDDKYAGEVLNTWEQIYESTKNLNKFPIVLIHELDQDKFRKFVKIEKRFTKPEIKFEFDWLFFSKSFAGIIEVSVGSKKDIIGTKLEQVIQRHIPYLQLIIYSVANELSNNESVIELLEKKMFSLIRLTQLKYDDVRDWVAENWTKINDIGNSETAALPKIAFWTEKDVICELLYDRTEKRWSLGPKITLAQLLQTVDEKESDLFRYMLTLCSLPFVADDKRFWKHVETRNRSVDERHSVNKNKFLKSNFTKLHETAKSYLDITLSPEQLEILDSEPSHLVLYGEAGTGKTTLLFALIKKKYTQWKNGELAGDTKIFFVIDQSKLLFREFVSHFINENKFENFVTIIESDDVRFVSDARKMIFICDEWYMDNYERIVSNNQTLTMRLRMSKMCWISCVLPPLYCTASSSSAGGFFIQRCLTTLFRSAVHISRAALKLKYRSLDNSNLSFASPISCRNFFSNQRFIQLEQIESPIDFNQRIGELISKKQIEQRDYLQIRYPYRSQGEKFYFTGIEYDSVVFFAEEVPESNFTSMLEALYLAMTRAVSSVFIFCIPRIYDRLRPLIQISELESVEDQILLARLDPFKCLATYDFTDSNYQELMYIAMHSSDVKLLRLVCDSYPVFDLKRYSKFPSWLTLLFLTEKSEEFLAVLGEFLRDFCHLVINVNPMDEECSSFVQTFYLACQKGFRNVVLWTLNLSHSYFPDCVFHTCLSGDVVFLEEVLNNFPLSASNSTLIILRPMDFWLPGKDEMIKYIAERTPEQIYLENGNGFNGFIYYCHKPGARVATARYLVDVVKNRFSVSKALEMLEDMSAGFSSLHAAVQTGSLQMCKTILELQHELSTLLTSDEQKSQKRVNAFVERRGEDGRTALTVAIGLNISDILIWLLKEVNCCFFELDESLYEEACGAVGGALFPTLILLDEHIKSNPDLLAKYPNSPIVQACYQNYRFKVVQTCFAKGESKPARIFELATSDFSDGQLNWLKQIYLSGQLNLAEKSSEGVTLLHVACRFGLKLTVEWMVLQDHSLMELRDNRGFLPVHYLLSSMKRSEQNARFQLFKWIVEAIGQKKVIWVQDRENNNLAHFAISRLNLPCYNYLSEICPKLLKQPNNAEKTPTDFYNFWLSLIYPITDISTLTEL